MIYLYAITEPDAEPPECPGLEDAPVRLLAAGTVAGVCSHHERAAFDPEPAALWRHDTVVEALMSCAAVLPARFGTTFGDADALLAALQRDEAQLRRALEEVRGCVELAVRVSLPDPAAGEPASGSEYVRSELARRRERRWVAERTLAPLEPHAVRSRPGYGEKGDLTASYLVRADAVDTFAEQVRSIAQRHSELAVSCTGPWAPYSFVGAEE